MYYFVLYSRLVYAYEISQLICTVSGGLVNTYSWTRNGVVISDSDTLFNQSLTITDKSTVTSQLVLSSYNISSLVGTYQCRITDGNRRISIASYTSNNNIIIILRAN